MIGLHILFAVVLAFLGLCALVSAALALFFKLVGIDTTQQVDRQLAHGDGAQVPEVLSPFHGNGVTPDGQ